MDFFVDENLPSSTAESLREIGIDVKHVREVEMKGVDDRRVAEYARERDAVLVTKDLEFGSPVHYSPEDHIGVLVVRLSNSLGTEKINSRITDFIEDSGFESLKEQVTVLEQERFRKRPLDD